jgi:hypothetical protein
MPPRTADSLSPPSGAGRDETEQASWPERLQRGLDRVLVADVFLVLAGALWFGLGVVLHLRGIDRVLETFQQLWLPLFQPALGLLMLAALISGALGWWRRRGRR